MKIKKPITPGQREMKTVDYSILTKREPEKRLTLPLKKKAGRNKGGRITVRHRGGGAKRKYRIIDFGQKRLDVPAEIETIEYDPNRSAFIALLKYEDGDKSYILAPDNIKIGDRVICSKTAPVKIGNRVPLKNIPVGVPIFNIEIEPGRGGKIVRSAGTSAQILSKEGDFALIKLPSKEQRLIHQDCFATIGSVSNPENKIRVIGKAGIRRHMGIRPTVRGSAMNPVDHPHGGGEGRAPIGLKYPKTPWGKPALGKKTRKKKKWSNRYIVKRRKRKK